MKRALLWTPVFFIVVTAATGLLLSQADEAALVAQDLREQSRGEIGDAVCCPCSIAFRSLRLSSVVEHALAVEAVEILGNDLSDSLGEIV